MRGIGFDATCSLAVLAENDDKAISVCGPDFTDHKRNVIRKEDRMLYHQIKRVLTGCNYSVDGSCNFIFLPLMSSVDIIPSVLLPRHR